MKELIYNKYVHILFLTLFAVFGNIYSIPLVVGINFLFGAIFVLLIIYYYGSYWGVLAAFLSSMYPLLLFSSPYTIVYFVGEAVVISFLLKKTNSVLYAGVLYWLIIGAPFVFIYWFLIMKMSVSTALFVVVKNVVNAVFNLLTASLIINFSTLPERFKVQNKFSLLTIDKALLIIILSFAFYPVLIITIINSSSLVTNLTNDIKYNMEKTSQSSDNIITSWSDKYISLIEEDALEVVIPGKGDDLIAAAEIERIKYNYPAVKNLCIYDNKFNLLKTFINKKDYSFNELNVLLINEEDKLKISSSNQLFAKFIFDPKSEKKRAIYKICLPVINNNKLTGYVFALINIDELRENLESLDSYRFIETNIINDGKLILSTNPLKDYQADYKLYNYNASVINDFENIKGVPESIPYFFEWSNSGFQNYIKNRNIKSVVFTIGYLHPYVERIYSSYLFNFSILLAILWLSFFLSIFLTKKLALSLNVLASISTKFAANQNENTISKLPEAKIFEIKTLIENFESMRKKLIENFKTISEYNELLENKINERTIELKNTNEELKNEIDKKEKIEKSLKISENLYKTAATNIPESDLYLFDKNLKYLFAEGSEMRKHNLSGSIFEGKYLHEVLAPEIFNQVEPVYKAALRGEETSVEVTTATTVYKVRAIPIYNEEGKIETGLAITQNITFLKNSLEELRLSNKRFQIVSSVTTDAIWDWDLQSNLIWYSEGYGRLFGYPLKEFEFADVSREKRIHPDDLERVIKSAFDLLNSTSNNWEQEYRYKKNDGNYILVLDRGYVVRNETGKAIKMIGGMSDITEQKDIELQLRSVKEFYESVLESINDGILVTSINDNVSYVNQAAAKIFNLSKDKILNKNLFEIYSDDSKDFIVKYYKQVKASLQPKYYQTITIKGAGNNNLFYSGWLLPIIKDGRYDGMICNFFDITDKKNAEKKLQTLNYSLKAILDAAPVSIFDLDLNGNIKSIWNAASERMFGWNVKEVIGKNPPITPKHKIEEFRRLIQSVKFGVSFYNMELNRIKKDGSDISVSLSMAPMTNENNEIDSMIAICADITDERKYNADLLETRTYLQNLIDYANAPIITWNKDFRITLFNHAFEKLTGYYSQEVIGKKINFLFPLETKIDSLEKINETQKGEFFNNEELEILCKNGTRKIVLWNSSNIYTQDKKSLLSTIAQGQDITERKLGEEKINDLNKNLEQKVLERTTQLEAVNKELEAFSYSVSHDLRAPLRTINGFSLALLEDYGEILDVDAKDYLGRIRNASQRMAELIDDMLNLSRITRKVQGGCYK